jgi:hypothetical protein
MAYPDRANFSADSNVWRMMHEVTKGMLVTALLCVHLNEYFYGVMARSQPLGARKHE